MLFRSSSFFPTLIVTTVANVLDQSFLGRLDFSLLVTPSARLFLYVEVPFGSSGSEFLYQPDPSTVGGGTTTDVELGLFRAGINLRMRI